MEIMTKFNTFQFILIIVFVFKSMTVFGFISDGSFPVYKSGLSLEEGATKNTKWISTSIANLGLTDNAPVFLNLGGGYSDQDNFFYFLSFGKSFTQMLGGTISYMSFQSGIVSSMITPRLYIQNYWDDVEKAGIKTKLTFRYINFQAGLSAVSLRVNVLANQTWGQFTLFGGVRFPIVQTMLKEGYYLTGEITQSYAYAGAEYKINDFLNIYSQVYKGIFGIGISINSPIGSLPLTYGSNSYLTFGHPFWGD